MRFNSPGRVINQSINDLLELLELLVPISVDHARSHRNSHPFSSTTQKHDEHLGEPFCDLFLSIYLFLDSAPRGLHIL